MHVYDAATNRLHGSYDAGRPGDGPWTLAAAFSPDSKQLAVILHGSGSTEPVRLLDPNTMEPATELAFPDGEPVWAVDGRFAADGHHFAITVQTVHWPIEQFREAPGYALVWDLRSPSTLPVRVPTGTDVQGMALSPDGGTLYTGWPLTAYDVATGRRLWQREDLTAWYTALDLNGEGTVLAIVDSGDPTSAREILLVDPVNGETVRTLRGHRRTVNDLRFSPDGRLVGSVANDGELIVWDTEAGRPVERWDTLDPYSVGIAPGNDLVHGGGLDSMLRTWDLSVQDTYLRRTTRSTTQTASRGHTCLPTAVGSPIAGSMTGAAAGSGSSTPRPGAGPRQRAFCLGRRPMAPGSVASRRRPIRGVLVRRAPRVPG